MPVLFRDYETHSLADLRNVGAWRYSTHSSTDVWCCAYAMDDGEIKLWKPDKPIPEEFIEAAKNPDWIVSAFNDAFERRIEQHIMAPRYGWPRVPLARHRCSQAAALALALPASLEKVAAALDLPQQKDQTGHRLMMQMARPRAPRQHEDPNSIYWFDDSDRRERLYEYCKQDVATERAIHQRIPPLSPEEQRLWELDAEINDRAIPLDVELLHAALAAVEIEQNNINQEFIAHTQGCPGSINEVAQLLTWLQDKGCDVKNVRSATLEAKLKQDDLSPTVRRVIELRLAGAHASVNKLRTMAQWCDSGRVRGAFRYHGASTGRFTSLGVQLQNLKRPETEDLDAAIAAVASGNLNGYEQPMAVIGDISRAIIAASPGHRFIAADLSGIESRITAWVAGQQSKVNQWAKFDLTKNPEDEPYRRIGLDCFKLPEESARDVGKIGDLAFGYAGGVGAWRKLASGDTRTDDEIKQLQKSWRDAHPNVVQFWKSLDRSAVRAVKHPGATFACGKVSFRVEDVFLKLRLPSGRELSYPFPRVVVNDRGDAVVVFKDNSKGRFVDCRNGHGAYGGLWMENVVQAIARDVFTTAMPALERAGYPVVLHVHDEIVAEVADGFGTTEEFVQILTTPPTWAEGLPLAAKGRNGARFAKASKPAAEPRPEPEPELEPPPHTNGGDSQQWQDYNFDDYTRGENRSGSSPAQYIYRDSAGEPIRRVKRTANKQFPQERWNKASGSWIGGKGALKGVPHYPYRLPELNAADPDESVFVCEGEKDAENVAALGLIATTNDGAAGKWMPELNKWFAGRRVVLLADNDEPGRMHVAKVAAMLAEIAAEIVTVHFPELPVGGDVSDWLDQGYGKAELFERVESAKANPSEKNKLVRVSASSVEMAAVDWFWQNRIARGKINLLGGLPDQGKGQLAAFLAAAATGNIPFPFGEGHAPQGNVIWFNAEDDRADTVVPRLKAAGADLSRIKLVTSARVDGQDRTFNLQSDLPLLRDTIREIGDTVLVILDPVGSYLGVGKVNPWRGNDVRAVLAPLKELVEELHTTAFGIVHFNKKDDVKSALLRIADSIAFTAVPRSVYAAITDPEDPKARLFLRVKNNVAEQDVPGLRYAFEVKTVGFDKAKNKEIRAPQVVWLSRAEMSANDAMAAASGESGYAKREAREFLEELLAAGPVLADEVIKAAKQNGISQRTLHRAKKELNVRSDKTDDGWVWVLPKKAKDDQDCQGG